MVGSQRIQYTWSCNIRVSTSLLLRAVFFEENGGASRMTLCDVCSAEGYPYDEETCKDCEYNPNREEKSE